MRRLLVVEPRERLAMLDIFYHPWVRRYEQLFQIDIQEYVKGYTRLPFSGHSQPTVLHEAGKYEMPGQTVKGLHQGMFGDKSKMVPAEERQTNKKPSDEDKSVWESLAKLFGCS